MWLPDDIAVDTAERIADTAVPPANGCRDGFRDMTACHYA
jgi:hypothetical protein